MANKLDIVIFGATGFTGNFVIRTLSKFSKTSGRQFTWGIAGRSEEKLKEALADCAKQLGYSLNDIPVIVADVKRENTIKEMARRARLIINCCGPFGYFGEPVVKACVEEGTHQLDVTAEVPYMEKMQLRYHEKAKETGAYIISACGFGSIPVDLGIVFLQQKFGGTLNSVEALIEFWEEGGGESGSSFNYSTWESAMYTFENSQELVETRRQLFPNKLPNLEPELKLKVLPHKSEFVKGWLMPFETSDGAVVQRSQRYFYEKEGKRPVQVETYLSVKKFVQTLMIMFFGMIVMLLGKFSCGRDLLRKYPETFSGGLISRGTPTVEKTERIRFRTTLHGLGWSDTLDGGRQHTSPPNKVMTARVSGRNPGYGGTAIILGLAAITVVTEKDKMPASGGVYPPGYAFAKTSLVEQLNKNEISFQILDDKKST